MSSVEDEIVSMRFENSQFLSGITASLNALAHLKSSLTFPNAGKGLGDIQSQLGKVSAAPVIDQAHGISKAFIAASAVAVTAIATITSEALRSGAQLANMFTGAPIKAGFDEYETNLNSIQTILANTGLEGQKGLDTVNAALQELNTYSDKTIYNFSEMAKNIGTFTAAGVDLDTSTQAIKGIANLAALSGSSASQAATGMYQLSQALATGTVRLMDWNSVQTAGFGGKVFQEAIKETARAHGVAVDEMIKENGSFRDSLQEGWFTSEILTETLSKFTGDLTKKQIISMGYTEKQADAILKQAKVATDAATKVKTMSQLMGTLQEAMGSGWSKTWQTIFGDFNEARGLFTGINNVLSGAITKSANARNKVLADWKELGGRDLLLDALARGADNLLRVLKPIKGAFRDIFPRKTGEDLMAMTESFSNFVDGLRPSKATMEDIRATARGFFSVLDIGIHIVTGIAGVIGDLFSVLSDGDGGGLLNVTAGVGDFLTALDNFLVKGGALEDFFNGLSDILAVPVRLIGDLAGAIASLFGGFDGAAADKAVEAVDKFGNALSPLEAAGQRVGDVFSRIGGFLTNAAGVIGDAIGQIGDLIASAFTPEVFSQTLGVIQTGLLAGILLLLKNFFTKGLDIDLTGGLFGGIKETLGAATGALQTMQTNLKADILLKIAGALALLTASLVILAMIDGKKLAKAMTGVSAGLGILGGALVGLAKFITVLGAAKLPFIAVSIAALAVAMLALALAVKIFATMNLGDMARGLFGVAASLTIIGLTMKLMPTNLPLTAAGLVLIGFALNEIAAAMKIFATMKWEEIGKGLVGIAGALLAITAGVYLMPASLPLTAAGLVLVGIALNAIAASMKIFATMKWEEIAKGVVGVAGALAAIGLAMQLMPLTLPITAVGLVLVATALTAIAAVAKVFASMSWEDLAKAGVALAGTLAIIAVAMDAMLLALPGAAALLVVSAALAVLAPVLVVFGAMSWESIAKGMVALAGALTIIGIAGLLLTPIILPLMGLGVAVLSIGAGLALAGAGALAFSAAFALFIASLAAGIGPITEFMKVIPEFGAAIGEGIANAVIAILGQGGEIVDAWVKLLGKVLDGIGKMIPKIGQTFVTIVMTAVKAVRATAPALISTGLDMLLNFLQALASRLPRFIDVGADIVVKVLQGLGRNSGKMADAAAKMIIDFVNALAEAIRNNRDEMNAAGVNLASAIIEGMISGLRNGGGLVADAAKGVAKAALNAAKDFLGIHSPSKEFYKIGKYVTEGFRDGLVGGSEDVKNAMKNLTEDLKNEIRSLNDEIDSSESKLKQLKKKGGHEKQIQQLQKQIKLMKEMRNASEDALKVFSKGMDKQKKDLLELGKLYDAATKNLADAEAELKKRQDELNSFQSSTTASFGAKPDITEGHNLDNYIWQVEEKTKQTQRFMETLAQLRALGLDDESYKQLLAEGLDAQALMDQLLAGGGAAVGNFNQVNANLAAISGQLGSTAAKTLYQAGVDSAQGLVNGFKSEQANLEAQMDAIAKAMIKAIKKRLKIKSPSRAFAEVGELSSEGVAVGLRAGTAGVEQASADVGTAALETLQVAMSKVSDGMSADVNLSPVITPVLDLTQMQTEAARINDLLATAPVVATVSYQQASDISATKQAVLDALAESAAAEPVVQSVTFEQTINAPEGIDAVDVYRGTKSQFSLMREALKI